MTIVFVGLFWLLALWAFWTRGPALLYMFFGAMSFSAFAVVPPAITGGLTLTATPIISMLIVARAFLNRSGPDFFLTSALRPNRLGLLFLYWLVAIVTTLLMPSLFANEVLIVPMRGIVTEPSLLSPSPQNISQLVYLSFSILTVFAFARILRSSEDRQHALKALCFGGAMVVLTGLLDFATQYLPIEPLLAPFRTATYSLLTNAEVLGGKRVVGLTPEASAFGGIALSLLSALVFFRRAIADARIRNVYVPMIMGGLLLCCWLAKSSGTYVGVAVLVVVMGAEALLRAFSKGRTKQLYRQDLIGELSVVFGLFGLALLFVILQPTVIEPVFDLVDRMVLQKTDSSSFAERSMWRETSFDAIFNTNGLGVGVGSTRASSSLVAIFASTGVLGGVLYVGFMLQTLLRRSTHMDWEGQFILAAFRFSFIAPFVVSLVVGGTDFGAVLAFGFGIVTATAFSSKNLAAKKVMRHRRNMHARSAKESRGRPQLRLSSGRGG